jgi:diguanylate cyclase (GGDEF)-like protein/PAS domain S-box-containing protein
MRSKNKIENYILAGFIFGSIPPIIATGIELINEGEKLSFPTIMSLHISSPLLWLIDLTPIVMVIFMALIGRQSSRLNNTALQLEKQLKNRITQNENENYVFQALINNSPFAVVQLNLDGQIIELNPAFKDLFGYSHEEVIGKKLDEIIVSDSQKEKADEISKLVASGKIISEVVQRMKKGGSFVDVEIIGVPVIMGGKIIGVLGLYLDISIQKRMERDLIQSESRFRSLFDYSPISLWEEDFSDVKNMLDSLGDAEYIVSELMSNNELLKRSLELVKIINVNQATLDMYNASSKNELLDGLTNVMPEESIISFRKELIALVQGKTHYESETTQKRLDGKIINTNLRLTLAPGYEDNWEKVLFSMVDITEQKRTKEKLIYLSYHDSLTDLYNRAYFDEEISRLGESRHYPVGIISCDIDDLKAINDTFGHDAGDQAIKGVAKILSDVFRNEDVIARLGGDEFAGILPYYQSRDKELITNRLEKSIIEYNGGLKKDSNHYRPISLSYGFALIPSNGSLIEGCKQADKNMYLHKNGKR